MGEIKLTKNELRNQQVRLAQLERYLPTLQLKKAMLQAEVQEARLEIEKLQEHFDAQKNIVEEYAPLFTAHTSISFSEAFKIHKVHKRYENIAGVEVPYFESVEFQPFEYSIFDSPIWVEGAINGLKKLSEAAAAVEVGKEKKEALEKELREVSIRVNLFEKILIPRALDNIKKIKVFLGDLQLSAVSQAKIAKAKIVSRSKRREGSANA